MPYIEKSERARAEQKPFTAGELNYSICRLILAYQGRKGKNYATINDILGALSGATLEYYRREVAGYEDKARDRNGEVFFDDV